MEEQGFIGTWAPILPMPSCRKSSLHPNATSADMWTAQSTQPREASFYRKVTAAFSLILCSYGYHQLLGISVLSEKYFVLFTSMFIVNKMTRDHY